MDEFGKIGTLPDGAKVVPLKRAAGGPMDVHPRTLARMCDRGEVLAERSPGKIDKAGNPHGRWFVAVRDNGLPIFRPRPAKELRAGTTRPGCRSRRAAKGSK